MSTGSGAVPLTRQGPSMLPRKMEYVHNINRGRSGQYEQQLEQTKTFPESQIKELIFIQLDIFFVPSHPKISAGTGGWLVVVVVLVLVICRTASDGWPFWRIISMARCYIQLRVHMQGKIINLFRVDFGTSSRSPCRKLAESNRAEGMESTMRTHPFYRETEAGIKDALAR